MPIDATVVWEIRHNGADTNGGGFKPGASGTDWTLQTAAQYALTGIASGGAGNTFLTAAAAADMVGNVANVVSGTNFATGHFEITSVVVGVSVTVSTRQDTTAICSGVGASGVINIGGAKATIGSIGSNTTGANPGGTAWVKKTGTYARTTNTDTVNIDGTATLPFRYVGYNSTRGDGYLGRTNGNGALITTNMPVITFTTGRINGTGTFTLFECLNVTSAATTPTLKLGNDCAARGCVADTTGSNTNSAGMGTGTRSVIFDCDVTCSNATGQAISNIAVANSRIIGCRIKANAVAGISNTTGSPIIIGNTIYESAIGIRGTNVSGTITAFGNTLVANAGDGVEILASTTGLQCFINTMVTDNGQFGFDFSASDVAAFVANARTRDNSSGASQGATNWLAITNYSPVTTDTGGATSDYVDPTNDDYSLVSSSPAAYVGVPLYASIGALQRNFSAPTGGGGLKLAGAGGLAS